MESRLLQSMRDLHVNDSRAHKTPQSISPTSNWGFAPRLPKHCVYKTGESSCARGYTSTAWWEDDSVADESYFPSETSDDDDDEYDDSLELGRSFSHSFMAILSAGDVDSLQCAATRSLSVTEMEGSNIVTMNLTGTPLLDICRFALKVLRREDCQCIQSESADGESFPFPNAGVTTQNEDEIEESEVYELLQEERWDNLDHTLQHRPMRSEWYLKVIPNMAISRMNGERSL